MDLTLDGLGVWTDEIVTRVERGRVQQYAAATNETSPALMQGEYAPPLFAAVAMRPALHKATDQVLPPDLAKTLLIVHGEHDLELHQPMRSGMTLRTRGMVSAVRVTKAGTGLVIKLETRDERGAPVNTQYQTTFLPGRGEGISVGVEPPDHRFPEALSKRSPDYVRSARTDKDQTFRYAEASGDHSAIHKDDALARSRGLPGIIVHGVCTMAMATRSVVECVAGGDHLRLRRVAVRFSRNVVPGQELVTRIWADPGSTAGVYRFETMNDPGDRVLTHGLAVIRA